MKPVSSTAAVIPATAATYTSPRAEKAATPQDTVTFSAAAEEALSRARALPPAVEQDYPGARALPPAVEEDYSAMPPASEADYRALGRYSRA